MSIKEKLKGIKKTAVMAGLAVAGVAAPIKGHSAETTPVKEPARTMEVSKAQKDRQQLFARSQTKTTP